MRRPIVVWALSVFTVLVLLRCVVGEECVPFGPPPFGVLKCQRINRHLQCLATCYGGRLFASGEEVVERNCNHVTGQWLEGNDLPVCVGQCTRRLLADPPSTNLQAHVTVSSDAHSDSELPVDARVLLNTRDPVAWTAGTDDMAQYVQVELPYHSRISGVALRGDTKGNYVTGFRVLFSNDGVTWYPYWDGEVLDMFLPGNSDSEEAAIQMFVCPHEARYVRVNPITWVGHVTMAFDLIGCPLESQQRRCKPPAPPMGGVVNCEVDGSQMLCTAYCMKNKIFPGNGPVVTRSCFEDTGVFVPPEFPPCIDRDATHPPSVNITGFCMESEIDCFQIENGDYQYCGDCHYFATCSHNFFYVRACPAYLQFDSLNRLCDYKSRTCSTKTRRMWLAEMREGGQPPN